MFVDPYYIVVQKIFVKGFYKAHAGALFFFFSVILFYFLFIGVLDKMPDEAKLSWNLIFARLILKNWWMVAAFSVLSFLYVIKSIQYVLAEMYKEKNQIVQHCSQCFSNKKLGCIWIWMQFQIMVPLFAYSLFIGLVGLLFSFSIKAISLILLLLILLLLSTILYIKMLHIPADRFTKWQYVGTFFFAKRSLSTLYLWHVVNKLKLLFVLTKFTSWLLILGAFLSTQFSSGRSTYNYFIASVIAMTNSLLVFKEYQFNTNYTYWSFNFPKPKWIFFSQGLPSYLLFLLPELLWILGYFPFLQAMGLIIWIVSIIVVYRGVLFASGANMKSFFKLVFALFLLLYLISIYGLALYCIPLLIFVGYALYDKNFPLKKVFR